MNKRFARRTTVGFTVSVLALVPIGAAVASTGEVTSAGQACTVETLPLPDNVQKGSVSGGDPTGRTLVGGGTTVDGERVGLLWLDDEVRVLTGLPSLADQLFNDVNSSGDVVGEGENETARLRVAWTYSASDEEYHVLAGREGDHVGVEAINEAGQAAGWRSPNGSSSQFLPVAWSVAEPDTFHQLTLPFEVPPGVLVKDISENGVIVAAASGLEGSVVVWEEANSPGTQLTGPSGGTDLLAYDISDNGQWIVGIDYDLPSGEDDVLWNLEAGTATPVSIGTGIPQVNSQGDILLERTRMIHRIDGSTVELPVLTDDGAAGARRLFDRDAEITAAGGAVDADGVSRPVVWRSC